MPVEDPATAQDRQPPKARVQYRWRFLHRHGRVYRGGLTCSQARYQWLAELPGVLNGLGTPLGPHDRLFTFTRRPPDA